MRVPRRRMMRHAPARHAPHRNWEVVEETGHYRPVQGMIGTAEMAFIGDPSMTRLLIAT